MGLFLFSLLHSMSTKIPSQRAVSITKTATTKLVETVSACKIENSVDTDQTAL